MEQKEALDKDRYENHLRNEQMEWTKWGAGLQEKMEKYEGIKLEIEQAYKELTKRNNELIKEQDEAYERYEKIKITEIQEQELVLQKNKKLQQQNQTLQEEVEKRIKGHEETQEQFYMIFL